MQTWKINCIWSFFATSHGKSPCDGIGGTIKRLTALRKSAKSQIMDAEAKFEFCQNAIAGITSVFIISSE